ncbi:MAG: acetyl-CoA carboxylase carboxyltransferase subunit beta [Rhodospirillaceae bacterium]|nr:acetyl-CoA carboxylase carboxyltransferase subunit beta [Rhodospirillaceae bacterium]MBT5666930.1 acetyl-CoA carboxylase carboxyltransferase subunit beta [Rhodospirillaceae bacterium]MBT5811378.1 acetyl-CoA carboxylase carboxyltransferase subunit beta [Rhodospirillaceae bacterium]
MNWLTNFVRPKLRALVKQADVPEKLWRKCPECDQMIFHRDLERNLHVCQHCGHHMRMPVEARLRLFFDDGVFTRAAIPDVTLDPLKFRDQKRYTDRLRDAQRASGEDEAIIVAAGAMNGRTVVVAVFNFSFMGGSMGRAVGEGVLAAAKLAVEKKAPLIVVPASGGARMQEGILSLMQMPRTVIAVQQVKEAELPYIVLLTDPTTGGVTASFAMLGDIQIAEPGALIGFAGQRVIEQTVRENLPEGFQRAEYLLEHGMIDMVTPRADLKQTLSCVFDLLCNPMPDGRHGGGDNRALTIPDMPDSAHRP